ncbi:ankyrin repeat-containing domain protein [Xylaria castorea]|nr:ankyrin repeat-containing domain protein [Xylaria castorea]
MLQELLKTSETNANHFMSGSAKTAIEKIIEHGDISRLKCLIEHFQRDDLQSLALSNLIFHWKRRHSFARENEQKWDECFDLVLPSSEQLIEPKSGNELLCTAVRMGCFPVVKKLFEAAVSNPALRDELLCDRLRGDHRNTNPSPYEHQSVGVAVNAGDLDMLRYLLNQAGIEAHLNHIDVRGYSVLHFAAFSANLEIFKLLVPRLKAQVNMINKGGDTALNILVFANGKQAVECAKVLMREGGADVSAGNEEEVASTSYHHPLRIAVRGGYMEMCQVLIEHGHADPRVALDVYNGEASLLDHVNYRPRSDDAKERARDILAMLSSLAGVKPSREVGPRTGNTNH